ncbi:MAG: S9 family peptidase [Acidobacteriota bacterium]
MTDNITWGSTSWDQMAWVPGFILCGLVVVLMGAITAPAEASERQQRGNLVTENIPELPEQEVRRLQRYQNARGAGLLGWLPDGGILIGTRFGETSQVHRVAKPGAARHQLTFFPEPVGGAAVSPSAKRPGFLFSMDDGGSEFFQLFFFDLQSGEITLMTDGKSLNAGATWDREGQRFVYYSTRRNGRDWDLYLGDLSKPGESKLLLEVQGAYIPVEFSPDGSQVLAAQYLSAAEQRFYIIDVESGEVTNIGNPDDGPVGYTAAMFSPDGKGLYLSSDRGTEFRQLRYLDLATGEEELISGHIPWNIEGLDVSPTGRYLAFSVNADGLSRLYLRDLESGSDVALPDLPAGRVGGMQFSPDGARLGLTLNSYDSPGDVYSLALPSGELTRWTTSEVGGLPSDIFIEPELVRFPTFDEVDGEPRTVPAFYYRPQGEGPFPVLIDIHGGPEAQRRPGFRSSLLYLTNELSVALISPNVRGSSGYGKTYLSLDNGRLREDSVKDIGALLDWIATRPELDADRVAVQGGSYGGYMVLASMIHFSDRVRAGIDTVGISNFVTFLENTEDYRRDLRRVEYGDERDPEMRAFLESISPTNHAEKIKDPLLVIQGLNDPRVPVTESEQMVAKIREGGGTVWYLLANDEGHGFRKKSNRDYAQGVISLFLRKNLLGEGEESAAEGEVGAPAAD